MSSFDLFLDLALIFFLLLVVLNYRAHRSVLYPPFIFCAMWLLVLLVVRLGLIELDPVHGNTLALVAAQDANETTFLRTAAPDVNETSFVPTATYDANETIVVPTPAPTEPIKLQNNAKVCDYCPQFVLICWVLC